jgi:hypothetical protein
MISATVGESMRYDKTYNLKIKDLTSINRWYQAQFLQKMYAQDSANMKQMLQGCDKIHHF